MESKKRFATSDWHVGHAKSLIYDHRPFRDLKHMHEVLINNYNSTVPKDGICYFLGDMGWDKSLNDVYPKLHGIKVLVLGNHDGSPKKFYDMGFHTVVNGLMINIGKTIITMSHCPLRGVFRESGINQDGVPMKNFKPFENWHGESRHDKFSFPDFGQYHLHGHTHKRKGNDVVTNRQWDIGVVGNNYRPVSFSSIEAWIAQQKKEVK